MLGPFRPTRLGSLGVSTLVLAACSSPPAPAPAAPLPPASSTAAAEAPPPRPKPTADAVPSASASAKPPADTRVRDACAALCKRKAQCASHDDDACQAGCAAHEEKAKGCEGHVAAALACQASAKEAPCGNFAASACTDAFVKMQRCQRGEAEPETAAATGKAPPSGWQTTKDETWGVSLLLPPGAALDTDAKTRRWKATVDGAEYAIRELPRPKTLDDQAAVKLVIADVGVTCQQNMRLYGRVDAAALTFLRFETECGKGARVFGKLYVDAKRALSLSVRGAAPEAQREAFLEGIH